MMITEHRIIKSQVFIAINRLIDKGVEEIEWRLEVFQTRVQIAYKNKGTINARTSYEKPGKINGRVEIAADLHKLAELSSLLDELKIMEQEIGRLQRYKLALLNDIDFTHGDNIEQSKVFGVPHKPMEG